MELYLYTLLIYSLARGQ